MLYIYIYLHQFTSTTLSSSSSVDLQVNRLRRVGNDQLKRSDCYQAAHYFNVSRQVLAKLEASQKIGHFGDRYGQVMNFHGKNGSFLIVCLFF